MTVTAAGGVVMAATAATAAGGVVTAATAAGGAVTAATGVVTAETAAGGVVTAAGGVVTASGGGLAATESFKRSRIINWVLCICRSTEVVALSAPNKETE